MRYKFNPQHPGDVEVATGLKALLNDHSPVRVAAAVEHVFAELAETGMPDYYRSMYQQISNAIGSVLSNVPVV